MFAKKQVGGSTCILLLCQLVQSSCLRGFLSAIATSSNLGHGSPWHSCWEAWRLISTLPLCLDSILKKYLPLCLVSVAMAHGKVLQPAIQSDSQPGWRPRAQGCASWARNPKGPQITPFCHQLGRHPTVLHTTKTSPRQNSGADLAR